MKCSSSNSLYNTKNIRIIEKLNFKIYSALKISIHIPEKRFLIIGTQTDFIAVWNVMSSIPAGAISDEVVKLIDAKPKKAKKISSNSTFFLCQVTNMI